MVWMIMERSTVRRVGRQIGGDFRFPTVAVLQQLLLVEEQLLASLGGEFEVRPLDDGIDRTGLPAETAVDAFGHVDVVARRPAASVLARLGLDRDGERRAHRFA